jgi:hypothetical protein
MRRSRPRDRRFGLRLRIGGSKNWIVQYALGAKQRRMTLGSTKVPREEA